MTLRRLITLTAAAVLLCSCQRHHQQPSEPVCIILDTDIGSSTDDLVAMKMLYDYEAEGRAKILAMMVNRPGDRFAEYIQKFNAFYGRADIPVGVPSSFPGPEPLMYIPYAEKEVLPPCFEGMEVTPASELPTAEELYRDILEKADDHSVDIISLGFLTNIGHLIDLYPELVERKVRNLYIMGCCGAGEPFHSYNVYPDTPAAQSVLRRWPGPIFVSPGDAGRKVDYPKSDVLEDYNEGGPLRWVYETIETDTGQRMWDCLPVIEAVEALDLFHHSEPGRYIIDDEGYTSFVEDPEGLATYHTITKDGADSLYAIIRSHGDRYR